MNNKELAEKILALVGGRKNVKSVEHCATRLRIITNDKEAIDVEGIESLEKVKGSFYNSGQYQIILGTGLVNKVYDEFAPLVENTGSQASADSQEDQKMTLQGAIRIFGDVFVPIIPVLVATGLFMGLRGLV
nr:PTS transporter subunit EIIB [Trichococcus flocculiformis]